MLNISAVIIARNEAKNIADCINSISFCDEVIVIDDNSTDRTLEIANQMNAKTFTRTLNGDFAAQQNVGIAQAQGQWVLLIDCDERVTPELKNEIENAIIKNKKIAYRIKRLNHFSQKRIRFGNMRPDYITRLIPKEGLNVVGKVHQTIKHPYKEKKLKSPMLHYTYLSWDEYYHKLEHYSRLDALKKLDNRKKTNFIFDIILKPIWAFFKMYFIHLGCLDGKMGLILAINHSYYTFTKYVRFYYLKNPF